MAHLLLDGSANTDADAPHLAAYNIAGDIDVRVRLSAALWSGGTDFLNPIARWGPPNLWQFQLRTTGQLRINWRTSGGVDRAKPSSDVVGFTDGQAGWIRFTIDVDNGAGDTEVDFYTSPDGDTPTWTQLGATQLVGATTDIATGSTPMTVGSRTNGGWWDGKIYRAQVYSGIDGTLVFDADFSDPTTWTYT